VTENAETTAETTAETVIDRSLGTLLASRRYGRVMTAWRLAAEPDSMLMDDVADLGAEVMGAEDLDYLDGQDLAAALAHWNLIDEHDLDAAMDIVAAIEEIEDEHRPTA
jgi:hypothetical protein